LVSRHDIPDEVLISRIKSGDQFAFEILFKFMHKKLSAYARFFIRDHETVNDLIQDTFIKIWEVRESLQEDKSIKAYLFRSVHNNCINYLNKRQLNIHQSEEYARNIKESVLSAEQGNDYEQLLDRMAQDEFDLRLSNVIDNLPPQGKEIFVLSRYHELTYKEIAVKLGISINTVKTQISRAFQKIREVLNDKV